METAAIWWRISSDDQKEISPDTQIKDARALAEEEGYHVPPEYIIGTDWGSLSVWSSPPMDRLKALIRERAIGAPRRRPRYDLNGGIARLVENTGNEHALFRI